MFSWSTHHHCFIYIFKKILPPNSAKRAKAKAFTESSSSNGFFVRKKKTHILLINSPSPFSLIIASSFQAKFASKLCRAKKKEKHPPQDWVAMIPEKHPHPAVYPSSPFKDFLIYNMLLETYQYLFDPFQFCETARVWLASWWGVRNTN